MSWLMLCRVKQKLTMRICDRGGAGFGGGCCEHHTHKVWGVFDRLLLFVHTGVGLGLSQFTFDALIDDKMDNSLRDASVWGWHAPVETSQAVHLVHSPHALECVHSPLAPVSVIIDTFNSSPKTLWFNCHSIKQHIPLVDFKVWGCSPCFQLQTGLNQPDGIGGCDGGEPWEIQKRSEVQTDAETFGRTQSNHLH